LNFDARKGLTESEFDQSLKQGVAETDSDAMKNLKICNEIDVKLDRLSKRESNNGSLIDEKEKHTLKFIISKIALKDAVSMSLAPLTKGFGINFIGFSPAILFTALFDWDEKHFENANMNEKAVHGYKAIFNSLKTKKGKVKVKDAFEFITKVICNFQSNKLWSIGKHIDGLDKYVTRNTASNRAKSGNQASKYLQIDGLWLQTDGSSIHFVFKSSRKKSAPPKYRQNGVLVSGDVFLHEIENDLKVIAKADKNLMENMANPSEWKGPVVTKAAFQNILQLASVQKKKEAFNSAAKQVVLTSDGGIRYLFGLCAHTRERVAANEPTKITVSIAALREILYTGPTTKLFNNLVQDLKMSANTQADQDGLDTIDDLLKTIASTKPIDDDGLALFVHSYSQVFERYINFVLTHYRLSVFYRQDAYKKAQLELKMAKQRFFDQVFEFIMKMSQGDSCHNADWLLKEKNTAILFVFGK